MAIKTKKEGEKEKEKSERESSRETKLLLPAMMEASQ